MNNLVHAIQCDHCGKLFLIDGKQCKIRNKVINHRPLVSKRYFKCPHCGSEYLIGLFDKELNKMVKKKLPTAEISAYQQELRKHYGG